MTCGVIKSLNGKRSEISSNQPITFSSKSLTRNGEIATDIDKQFTSSVPHSSDPSARIIKQKLIRECPFDSSVSHFPPDIVSQAIKNNGNSLAVVLDDLTIHHLKNVGLLGSVVPYKIYVNNEYGF